MSVVRWEHLTQHSPFLRFGAWLLTQLGTASFAGGCQSLAFEFDSQDSTLTAH